MVEIDSLNYVLLNEVIYSALWASVITLSVAYYRLGWADSENHGKVVGSGLAFVAVGGIVYAVLMLFLGHLVSATLGDAIQAALGAGSTTNIITGAIFELFIVGFGACFPALVTGRADVVFPSKTTNRIESITTLAAGAEQEIREARGTLQDQHHISLFESFSSVYGKYAEAEAEYQPIAEANLYVPAVESQLGALEASIHEFGKDTLNEILERAENRLKADEYFIADEVLVAAEHIARNLDTYDERIEFLREEFEEQHKSSTKETEDTIEQQISLAEEATDEARFNDANDHLKRASQALEKLESLTKDDNEHFKDRITSRRKNIEVERKQHQIREARTRISIRFDIPLDKVRIHQEGETVRAYGDLYDLLKKLKHPPGGDLPWEEFEAEIISRLPFISPQDINHFDQIVSTVATIADFIQETDNAHPSVHVVEWEEAIQTAVENQNYDILKPVIRQVERLNTGQIWDQSLLYDLSWRELENIVGDLYSGQGYEVTVTQGSADLGVDVWARKRDDRLAIQVKQVRGNSTVGRETLQKLASTIAKGDADRAVVVTTGEFARTAKQYAADFGPNLELIDGGELAALLSESESQR